MESARHPERAGRRDLLGHGIEHFGPCQDVRRIDASGAAISARHEREPSEVRWDRRHGITET
jgi:hypothetical protein